MGKGSNDPDCTGGLPMEVSLADELGDQAIRAALDFKQDRIVTRTVNADEVPAGWGVCPGFSHSPTAVGGINARWQVLVPYLLETYPDDFQLLGSEGVMDDNGQPIMAAPGSQYLAVRPVYPPDHPRAGQPTDGLLVAHQWTTGPVQGPIQEAFQAARREYAARHFRELVAIRARRQYGDLRQFTGGPRFREDLPADWEQRLCNAILYTPPFLVHQEQEFRTRQGSRLGFTSKLPGYNFRWGGHRIEKPVTDWDFNDSNTFVDERRLHAAALWAGLLDGQSQPALELPNLIYREERLSRYEDGRRLTIRRRLGGRTSVAWARERLEARGLQVEVRGRGEQVVAQEPAVDGNFSAILPGSTVILHAGQAEPWCDDHVLPEAE